MKLPHADRAFVAPRKLVGYLLAHQHSDGASKARFFASVGFTPARAILLNYALLEIARSGDVVEVESSTYGEKYVVEGTTTAPTGRTISLRTVWIIEADDDRPRLVTAYPSD